MLIKKERIIAITLALYKVTDFLPEKEVLRYKIREMANDILADLVCLETEETGKKINILIAYFQVAMLQNWIGKKNFLVLEREYQDIKQEIEEIEQTEEIQEIQKIEEINDFTKQEIQEIQEIKEVNNFVEQEIQEIERKPVKIIQKVSKPKEKLEKSVIAGNSRKKRQDKILELMEKQGRITLEQLKKDLSQVCPRTLRRDINDLVEENLIQRIRKSKKDVLFVLNSKKGSGQSILE